MRLPRFSRPPVWPFLVIWFALWFSLLVPLLIELWTVVSSTESGSQKANLAWGALPVSLDKETGLIAIVAVAGALGSFIHAAQSLTDYLGNKRFDASWTAWYLMRLPLGAVLAIVFYFVVRAGLISTDATGEEINPFGIVALGALAGLFAKQATDKLREVFETLFRVAPGKGDDERAGGLTNPTPRIDDLRPNEVTAGSGGRELRLIGRRFEKDCKVKLDGNPLKLEYISDGELAVTLTTSQMSKPGTRLVVVSNPPPGGGHSEPKRLRIVRSRPLARGR